MRRALEAILAGTWMSLRRIVPVWALPKVPAADRPGPGLAEGPCEVCQGYETAG